MADGSSHGGCRRTRELAKCCVRTSFRAAQSGFRRSKELPEGCGFTSTSSMNDRGGQATMNLLYKGLRGLLCEDMVTHDVGAHIGVYYLGYGLEHRWSLSNPTPEAAQP